MTAIKKMFWNLFFRKHFAEGNKLGIEVGRQLERNRNGKIRKQNKQKKTARKKSK